MTEIVTARHVKTFFDQLAFKLQTARIAQSKLDLYLANGLNIVRDYIVPDENQVSNILADLLDPAGSHGQGQAFLRLFLGAVKPLAISFDSYEMVRVRREVPTRANRRFDILIHDQARAIVIENKIEAGDQDAQISDYCDDLEKDYGARYVLLYLTPEEGRVPSDKSMEAVRREQLVNDGKLRMISYGKEIREWLNSCVKECKAEKVRWFIRDLVEYVDLFPGGDTLEGNRNVD